MSVKLLAEHHLEFLSLKGDCIGSSESTLVKCHIDGNHMTWFNLCQSDLCPLYGASVNSREADTTLPCLVAECTFTI